ncbi:O-antigen ligase family protein [Promicromonospora soli]
MTQARPAPSSLREGGPGPGAPALRGQRFDMVTWLTVYVVLLFAVPSKLVIGPLGSAGAPSMVFGLVGLLLWVLMVVAAARAAPGRPRPIRIALGAFVAGAGVSYAIAMSRPIVSSEISPADVALLALLAWSGTLLLAHDGIRSAARLDVLVWRLALAGGALAVLGITQFALGELLVDQISIPGLSLTSPFEFTERNGRYRPPGTATHPIEYGVLVAMLLPPALHVAFQHVERPRLLRWAPALALLVLIPLTGSRSTYVGAAVAVGVLIAGWPGPRRWALLGIGAAGAVAVAVTAPGIATSMLGLFADADQDPSVASRTTSLSAAGDFIARDPLFGRGLGTFLPTYRIFDNQYILLLVTVGVVGTALFVGLWLATLRVLLRVRSTSGDDRTRSLATALAASVSAGFVSLSFFDAFAFPMTMGTLFLLIGLSGALRDHAELASAPSR